MDTISESIHLQLMEEADETLSITTIDALDLGHIDEITTPSFDNDGLWTSRRFSRRNSAPNDRTLSHRSLSNLSAVLPYFSFESICADLREIVHVIQTQFKHTPNLGRDVREFLSKVADTAMFFEENMKLLADELHGEIPSLYDEGAVHTFLKLVAITWYRVKHNLLAWCEDVNQASGLMHTLKSKVFSVFHSNSSSKLQVPRDPIESPPETPKSTGHMPPSHNNLLSTPGGVWLKHIGDRHFELEQFIPVLPLIFMLLRERKTNAETMPGIEKYHIEALKFEDSERFHVHPFWWKYNPSLHKFNELLFTTFATIGASHKVSLSIRKYAVTLTTAIKCTLDPHHANKRALELHSNELDIGVLQRVWNILDVPWIAAVHGLILPSIAVSQNIVIPPPSDGIIAGMPIQAKIISAKPLNFKISHLIPTNSSYVSSLTRALSVGSKLFSPSSSTRANHSVPSNSIILHFHGGGWVSGSPTMHENYLRDWAIQVGVPILSVDYRLSPEYRFPIALEECYHVYKWLVTTSHLGMNVSKIAICGDSAGGNMTAGVTIKALQEGIRPPDGILLIYPALDMCAVTNVSRLLFKNDPLVPLSVMMACRTAYLPAPAATELGLSQEREHHTHDDSFDTRDPLVSPIHVSDEILDQFPPVYLMAGEFDPLLDESVQFSKRLKEARKLVQFKIYEGLPHGFLSLSKLIPEASASVQDAAQSLQEIVNTREDDRGTL